MKETRKIKEKSLKLTTLGFTLIELLAVIVILAIIALIAVPIILNIIDNTKVSSVKVSAENYIDAIELYIARSELDNNKLKLKENNKYNVNNSTLIESSNYLPINELVEVKGSKPTGKEDYITLNSDGQVTEGKLTISGYIIEIKNGNIVNVKKDKIIKVKELNLNITEQTMEKNSTFKLIPTFNPVDASNQEVTYESSNTNVVTVDELGNVKAINAGTAKITVTSKENKNIKAECNITVIVSATSLTLSPKEKQIGVGETVQLSGTINPSDVTSNALTWGTSNAEVATVNENGLVAGISEGEVEITATTVNGISDMSKITIKNTIGKAVTPENKTLAGKIPQGYFNKGDEYIVNVDGVHQYHFYVLKVEGDKVNLIMSNNICKNGTLATSSNKCGVAWYESNNDNIYGPVTAMNYLHEATKNWNNIENIQINYTDEGKNYVGIETNGNSVVIRDNNNMFVQSYSNSKARLPKKSEISGTGCSSSYGSCPAWMVNGLSLKSEYYPAEKKENISGIAGYWSLSSTLSSVTNSRYVYFFGKIADVNVNVSVNNIGIRPVIEVSKLDLS